MPSQSYLIHFTLKKGILYKNEKKKSAVNIVSPEANADDGSCWKREKPQGITTVRFGGVFQTCNSSASSDPDSRDLCSGLRQVNPSTGLASCPAGKIRDRVGGTFLLEKNKSSGDFVLSRRAFFFSFQNLLQVIA